MTTRPSRTIPESLQEQLAELYGEHDAKLARRRTYRDLAAWLREAHGIETSHQAVRRVVDPLRRERAELRRDALRERLTAQLAAQVDTLDDLMTKVAALTATGPKGKRPSAGSVLKALDEFRKGLDTKLRFAGVGERHEVSAEDAEGGSVAMTFYVPRKVDDDGTNDGDGEGA